MELNTLIAIISKTFDLRDANKYTFLLGKDCRTDSRTSVVISLYQKKVKSDFKANDLL